MPKQTKEPPYRPAAKRRTLSAKDGGAAKRNPGAARHEALAAKAAGVKPEAMEASDVGDA